MTKKNETYEYHSYCEKISIFIIKNVYKPQSSKPIFEILQQHTENLWYLNLKKSFETLN